jgi:hypothetical protein
MLKITNIRLTVSNPSELHVMKKHINNNTNTDAICAQANDQTIAWHKAVQKKVIEVARKGCHHAKPLAHTGGCYLRDQAKKIHQRENWSRRCSVTLIDNSAGLAMGMLAGHIVQSSVEVSQFSNLWGLLASKPVVSESTYQVMSFSVEFGITVVVFTLTEHFINEYRQKRNTREQPAN